VIRQSEKDFDEVVRLTANYARTGQGTKADADRAQADSLALRYEEQQAQEDVAVASAELAALLNLDPSTRLNTADVPIQLVIFVDPKMPLPKLLEIATRNRPELMAAAAAIRASQTRVRQEKIRPLLPTIWAGFSADDFGGGTVASTSGNVFNPHGEPSPGGAPSRETGGRTVPSFGRITGRTDVDFLAIWTLRNAGFGNFALIRERRAQLGVAEAERVRLLNLVAEEVSEAYNRSAAQFQSIEIERRRVQAATDGFQRDLTRIRAGQGRPIEVLNQAKRLASARQQLLEALIAFDRAQFELFVALGQPPTLAVEEDKPPPPPPPEGEMLPPAPPK
jgi:outer membrane protein TolC